MAKMKARPNGAGSTARPLNNHINERRASQITQEEIQMVMDLEHSTDMLFLNLRRRLRLGATVELGQWKLSDGGGDIKSDEGRVTGSFKRGLTISKSTGAKTAAA